MKILNKSAYCLVLCLILYSCFVDEVEARRRVLRGRRTLTRTYYKGLAIPGWAVIVLIALGEILVGVILYFAMRKFVLSTEIETSNTYTPARTDEI